VLRGNGLPLQKVSRREGESSSDAIDLKKESAATEDVMWRSASEACLVLAFRWSDTGFGHLLFALLSHTRISGRKKNRKGFFFLSLCICPVLLQEIIHRRHHV